MFDLPAWHASRHDRTGVGLWLGEVVATAGLLFVIGSMTRTRRGHLGAVLVPAWIGAAYFARHLSGGREGHEDWGRLRPCRPADRGRPCHP